MEVILKKNVCLCPSLPVSASNCCIISLWLHVIRDPQHVEHNLQFLQQAVNDSKTICLWTFPLTKYPAHMCEAHQQFLNDYLKCWNLLSSWMQLSPIVKNDIWELSHVFSSVVAFVYKPMQISYVMSHLKIIIHLYSMYYYVLQFLQHMK